MSRQKLHKWLGRHNVEGMKGLVDRSRAPVHIPHRTSDEIAAQIIVFRRRFPHMGPKKISLASPSCTPTLIGLRRVPAATSFDGQT
jgi:hypothetical protein